MALFPRSDSARTPLRRLRDQVVLVTGASSGIGLVTARMAARRGAAVMLVARGEAALAKAAAAIRVEGGRADHVVADVGDAAALAAAAAHAVRRFGRIDSWVQCAGVAIYAPLLATPADEHERLFRTNYFGVVNAASAAIPHLAGGGAFIVVGSVVSEIGTPVMGAYAASKHAAKGYVDSLRIELDDSHPAVSVTLIEPSGIDTPIAAHAANHLDGEAMIPPPVYDPALVARAILDAAVSRRREIVVGGVGRAQILAAHLVPGLFARLAGAIAPLLRDPDRPKTPGDNLAAPMAGGQERSASASGRAVSLYNGAIRHPAPLLAAGLVAGGTIVALRRRRRRRSGGA